MSVLRKSHQKMSGGRGSQSRSWRKPIGDPNVVVLFMYYCYGGYHYYILIVYIYICLCYDYYIILYICIYICIYVYSFFPEEDMFFTITGFSCFDLDCLGY